jgi:hypothetical protein
LVKTNERKTLCGLEKSWMREKGKKHLEGTEEESAGILNAL